MGICNRRDPSMVGTSGGCWYRPSGNVSNRALFILLGGYWPVWHGASRNQRRVRGGSTVCPIAQEQELSRTVVWRHVGDKEDDIESAKGVFRVDMSLSTGANRLAQVLIANESDLGRC